MSDEQRKDEEPEVEAHRSGTPMTSEPTDEAENDVEAHRSGTPRPQVSRPQVS